MSVCTCGSGPISKAGCPIHGSIRTAICTCALAGGRAACHIHAVGPAPPAKPCQHQLVTLSHPHCLSCGAAVPDPKNEKILKAIVAAVVAALSPQGLYAEEAFAARILEAARKELEQ